MFFIYKKEHQTLSKATGTRKIDSNFYFVSETKISSEKSTFVGTQ